MLDERRLYIKQLLRNYKKSWNDTSMGYTVKLTHHNGESEHILVQHNEGIDMVIQYIDELERKVDELQHIEKILKIAESDNV